MSQVNAGSGDRTHTALRPRDFKSERGISSDNDLRADAPASVSIPSPVVYSRLRFAVTPGVTPSIEGSPPPVRRGRTLEYHQQWRLTEKGKASLRESQRAYLERHPERVKAHRTIAYLLRRGKITRGHCEQAGADCKGRIEAHHDDYTKPLEVRWLCKRHHRQADAARRESAA
jgi:hypothetical protein